MSVSSAHDSAHDSEDFDSDLDDVPLFIPSSAKPMSKPMLGFASLALNSGGQSMQHGSSDSPMRPLTGGEQGDHAPDTLTTPDPGPPLPTSRTARRSVITSLRLPTESAASQQQSQPLPEAPEPPARPAARPMPTLTLPVSPAATSSPYAAQHSPQPFNLPLAAPSTTRPTPQTVVEVSLLSSAFVFSQPSTQDEVTVAGLSQGVQQEVLKRCSSSLGVDVSQMRVLRVVETQAQSGAAISTQDDKVHVAVRVDKSSFSLAALEDLLAQTNNLKSQQDTYASTIQSLVNNYSTLRAEHTTLVEERTQLLVKTATQEEQLVAERARHAAEKAAWEQEMITLRSQLATSDQQRRGLHATIKELKHDFQKMMSPGAHDLTGVTGDNTAPLPTNAI